MLLFENFTDILKKIYIYIFNYILKLYFYKVGKPLKLWPNNYQKKIKFDFFVKFNKFTRNFYIFHKLVLPFEQGKYIYIL